jgi:hypothetical protein
MTFEFDFLNTIILINYNPSCMSVRYSTPHVHYPQLNPSRVCLPTLFFSFHFLHISLFRWFRFVSFRFRWFRFVSFRFRWFRFVSFRFYFVSHFIGTPVGLSDCRIIATAPFWGYLKIDLKRYDRLYLFYYSI